MRAIPPATCILLFITLTPVHAVTVIISTDTTSVFAGSFSAPGASSTVVSPTVFNLFPEGDNRLGIGRDADAPFAILETFSLGSPAPTPQFIYAAPLDSPQDLPDLTGTYINTPGGVPVDFKFSNLADSGGTNGTFSGNFSFSVQGYSGEPDQPPAGSIPEPSRILLCMLGLLAAGRIRKRRSNSFG